MSIFNMKIPTYSDISINGSWFSEYGVYVAGTDGIELSVAPSKNVRSAKIMGKDGEVFFGSQYDVRTMQLPIYIENLELIDSFKQLIGFKEPTWITFKDTGLKIKGLFTNDIKAKTYLGNMGKFELTLTAYDPYFYEDEPEVVSVTNPTTFSVFNSGNEISFPTYEITGKGVVNIGVNGVVMTLNFSSGEYETLVVNTKTCEVRKASENRFYSNVDYVFPKLAIGINPIAVTGDCTLLKIYMNNMWI